jgi:DNA-binding MarR family transcriptional regulator
MIRSSNYPDEHAALVDAVATEVARAQSATAEVDEAAARILGIHATDLRVLGQLFGEGPTTAGALARKTRLSPGAMTAAIDRLERARYVERVRDDGDRRRVTVRITNPALDAMARIWGPIADAGRSQLAAYDERDLRLLHDFLVRSRELQEREAERIRQLRPG